MLLRRFALFFSGFRRLLASLAEVVRGVPIFEARRVGGNILQPSGEQFFSSAKVSVASSRLRALGVVSSRRAAFCTVV